MMYLQRENEGEWCNYEQSYPSPLQGLPSLPKSFGGVKMVEEGVGVLFWEGLYKRKGERNYI